MKKTIAKSKTAIMAAARIAGSLTACGGSDNKAESTTAVETTVEASESVEETTAEAADAEESTEAADAEESTEAADAEESTEAADAEESPEELIFFAKKGAVRCGSTLFLFRSNEASVKTF